jgi:nucleoside-diphosphate-sugar epimerase
MQLWDAAKNASLAGPGTAEHRVLGNQCYLLGLNLMQYRVWDASRAIDYLETRADVDADRIAMAGSSGGGMETLQFAAFEPRIKAAVPVSAVATFRAKTEALLIADPPEGPLDETYWTDLHKDLTAYTRSKTVAEMAAWELVRERAQEDRLAVVNPGAILGPVLADDLSYSLEVIERMLKGMPGVPNLGFSFVDVRDVARLEILAMTSPEAGGERFIAADRWLWMAEVASILRERLGERAAKVPTRTVPNLVVRGMALFDGGVRSVVGDLGKRNEVSSEKARTRLGWSPMPIEDSIAETAEALIAHGSVPEPAAG